MDPGVDTYPFYYPLAMLHGQETPTTLSFYEAPADTCLFGGPAVECSVEHAPGGSFLAFRTHLAGVKADGTPVSLGIYFSWTSNYNGTNGGAARTQSNTGVDPGSGTGGITPLDQQTTTTYPGTTV